MTLVILVSCFAFLKLKRERSNERNERQFLEFWKYISDNAFDVLRRNFYSFVLFEKKEEAKNSDDYLQATDKEWWYCFYIREVLLF